ncbi:MAG: LptF/LptG family permease [Gemmatimonadota bacterium]|nr:LptF/LptG family permease [Gemmatimonadota bacterium]MDQ8147304.1 LptF/LptG family permease [Gemmatimonadota bacterium]MDQ8149116.1 LptF/LptG family permease [Gemmatimonadota bacterium]MDQ8156322.1 LptF/LptG family permease [Gemmatimonadota bacterium]MDQ8176640.1 LptF/LptG family permease [Gemmatimonadota bacterium]
MKIVSRYILKEHLGPLAFAVSALTSLLLLNFVAKRLGDLVGKGLPWDVIAEFLLLSVPFTLAMTLPMAVLVATLHAFSRLASENEITAFKASGVSMQRLMVPVMLASLVLTAAMVLFNDQVLPRANHRLATLQSDIARVKPTLALQEQVINEVVPRTLFLRAARIASGTNQMHDVTIYDLGDPAHRRSIEADSGVVALSTSGEDLILTLFDGTTTEVDAERPARLQRSFFHEDIILVRGVSGGLDRGADRASYRSDRELSVCELRARVDEASVQRDSAWVRVQRSLGDSLAADHVPRIPRGVGGLYCDGVRRLQAWLTPPPAAAAVQSGQGDSTASGRPVTPVAGQPASMISDVMLEGMRFELTVAQNTIDQYRVEIEKKFAIASACFIFVLLGAPIALRFPRGGVGLTIGVSLGVFAIYYAGLLMGEALADRALLDPGIAMWGANLGLGLVGLVLTLRLGTEGSTSRGSELAERWHRWRARRRRPA